MELKHSTVRDLVWAVNSQAMVDSPVTCGLHLSEQDPWLLALDRHPHSLSDYLSQQPVRRLGYYFEALWAFYLSKHPGTQLIARNVQVFKNKQTLGEFDFIYYCLQRQRYFHLEVAVKFYLGVAKLSDAGDMMCWLGPQCIDSLAKKHQRLTQHQLLLSKSSRGRRALKNLGVAKITPELRLAGILFQPVHKSLTLPIQCAKNVNLGRWLKLSTLPSLMDDKNLWQLLDKTQWLAPQRSKRKELLSADELLQQLNTHFVHSSRPVMVAKVKLLPSGCYSGSQRYFVTPDNWPQIK